MNRLVWCSLACWVAGAACRSPTIPEANRFPAGTGFTARRLTIDGTTVRYIDAGRGTPVVFIHGLGASMYAWRKNLAPVAAAGLGAREPPLFRVGRWPLVGPLLFAFRGRGLTERFLKATYADPSKVSDADVDQYYAPVAEPEYGRALRAVLRQFRFDRLAGRLDHIGAPTLVLWGEADRLVPIALGRALAAGIPRAAFLSVPRAGHAVQEEAPDQVNRLLIQFLKDGLARVPGDLAIGRRGPIFLQPHG